MVTWLDGFEARATRLLSIEREDSRDRGRTAGDRSYSGGGSGGGGRSGSSGRPGGMGNQGQTNSRPTVTSYGAPIHYGDQNTNPISRGITVAQSPERWKTTVDRVEKYNSAARKWNAGAGPSIANTLNAFAPMGLSMQAPEFNKPATYTGGDYHLGINPAGAIVGAGALAAGIPGPWGSIAGKVYNALGGTNPVLSGPDVPKDWTKWGGSSLPGASMQGAPTPGQQAGPSTTQMAHAGEGNAMAAFSSMAPGGAPFGAQPTAGLPTTPTTPSPMDAFFTPKIANHTLPQGYESLFPTSLSDADKALLYGKALMG